MGTSFAAAPVEHNVVQVYDPYIELHTGPGRGYPVFYVVSRDEWVEIIVRQTDWFKVRSETGIEGWVARNEMLQTLSPDGKRIELKEASQEDFVDRRWEMGMLGGDFQGAYVITTYGGYHLTENISTEVSLSQVLGNLSSSVMLGFHLVEEPFPEWTVSPFFSLGTGLIETKAKSTLAVVKDRRNNFSHYSIGARMYLTKRFLVRIDYGNYVIFTTKDNNEEIREWKAGFAFFF